MIAITSISPGHRLGTEHQQACIQTWLDAGYKVYSLNAAEEIEGLQPLYPKVEFIPTRRHHKKLMGRPYVMVSAILDFAAETGADYTLIINSDIEINNSPAIVERLKATSEQGVIYMHRVNYDADKATGKMYMDGVDGFFINKKWLNIFPQSQLCLGQCFWDFWVPYVVSKEKDVHLYWLKENYLYHKNHPIQYNRQEWEYTGEIFRVESRLFHLRHAGQIANSVYKVFTRQAIAI
jgi:hypothetical protein